MPHPRLTILGGGHEIGANCYLLEWGGHSYVLDAGRHPSLRATRKQPWRSFQSLPDLDRITRPPEAILISHAHQDHIGSLPVLSRLFPETPVITSRASAALIPLMLKDASRLMRLYDDSHSGYDPEFYWETFYEKDDLDEVARNLKLHAVDFRVPELLPGGLEVTFLPNSHVLGSAGLLLQRDGYRIFYTGDFSLSKQEVHTATVLPPADSVDTVIMESTYGGKSEELDREAAHRKLGNVVAGRVAKGESILIPAFALGRAQDLLAALVRHKREGALPDDLPIYLFGLARSVTRVYHEQERFLSPQSADLRLLNEIMPEVDAAGDHLLYGPWASRRKGHQTERDRETRTRIGSLLDAGPCVLLATSGMMNPGSISWHAARVIAEQERHGILFVGYAAPHTPAGALLGASPGGRVRFGRERGEDGSWQDVQLVLRNRNLDKVSYSAHASRGELWQAVEQMSPKNVIVVHGDECAREELEDGMVARYPVFLPGRGDTLELRNDGPDRIFNLRRQPLVLILHGNSLYRRAARTLQVAQPTTEDLGTWLERENAQQACRETALLARHRLPFGARIVLLGGAGRNSRRVRAVLAPWLSRLAGCPVETMSFPPRAGLQQVREQIADLFDLHAPSSELLACADDQAVQYQACITAALLDRHLFVLDARSRPERMRPFPMEPDVQLVEQHTGLLEKLLFPELGEDPRQLLERLPSSLQDWLSYDEDMKRFVWSDFGRLFRQRWREELPRRVVEMD